LPLRSPPPRHARPSIPPPRRWHPPRRLRSRKQRGRQSGRVASWHCSSAGSCTPPAQGPAPAAAIGCGRRHFGGVSTAQTHCVSHAQEPCRRLSRRMHRMSNVRADGHRGVRSQRRDGLGQLRQAHTHRGSPAGSSTRCGR
jgi:hypothetical protein